MPPKRGRFASLRVRRNRRSVISGAAVAGAALAASALAGLPLATEAATERACCPARPPPVMAARPASRQETAAGNVQAAAVARRSRFVMRVAEDALELARTIPDATVRARTLELLANPAPTYQLRSPSAADRETVREELLAEGLIPPATTVDGIFPPVPDANEAPQPFWAAPGSGFGAHHSYPGGLAVHELSFARTATQYRDLYEAFYGVDAVPGAISIALIHGPALWHDIHKVSVFQWNADGSEWAEQTVADTGAHHTLSGAEAIVRGMSAAWVIAQLSAHDAPTNVAVRAQTGRQRLVNYLRAAAIIARVDAVDFGLLRRADGGGYTLAQDPPRIEGYLIHFADQDYLFTNDALPACVAALAVVAADEGINPQREPARFNLFRNLVLSQMLEVRLYAVLQQGGVDAVRQVVREQVDLMQLREA